MRLLNNKLLSGALLLLMIVMFTQGCVISREMQEKNARNLLEEQQYAAPSDSTYEIKKGDEIEILVWEQPNFNTTTTVSNLGTIAVPLVGEVKASGLTHDELKRDLTKRLSQYIKDEINLTVSIRSTDNMQVSVFGMVTRPDNYSVLEQTSIFKVLSMAGGPAEEANIRNVRIYRKDSNPHYITLDLTQYLDSGQINSVPQIYPGDIVYVPRKNNVVREMSGFLTDVVLLFGIFRVLN
jgi:polysaccharide export outer membrane protein